MGSRLFSRSNPFWLAKFLLIFSRMLAFRANYFTSEAASSNRLSFGSSIESFDSLIDCLIYSVEIFESILRNLTMWIMLMERAFCA